MASADSSAPHRGHRPLVAGPAGERALAIRGTRRRRRRQRADVAADLRRPLAGVGGVLEGQLLDRMPGVHAMPGRQIDAGQRLARPGDAGPRRAIGVRAAARRTAGTAGRGSSGRRWSPSAPPLPSATPPTIARSTPPCRATARAARRCARACAARARPRARSARSAAPPRAPARRTPGCRRRESGSARRRDGSGWR